MSPKCEVASLGSLALYNIVTQVIHALSDDEGLYFPDVTEYHQYTHPAILQDMLTDILKNENLDAGTRFSCLQVFLRHNVRKLEIGIFPHSYYERIMEVISTNGTGLFHLNLKGVWMKDNTKSLNNVLSKLTDLRILHIPHMANDDVLLTVANLQKLNVLNISGECNFTDQGLYDFSKTLAINKSHIKILDIGSFGAENIPNEIIAEIIESLPHLASLCSYSFVGKSLLNIYKRNKSFRSKLSFIHDTGTTKEVCEAVIKLCPLLENLYFDSPKEGVVDQINQISGLNILKLTNFQCDEFHKLFSVWTNSFIRTLKLSLGRGMMDASILTNIPNLTILEFYKMEFITHTYEQDFLRLEELDVSNCEITPTCLKYLIEKSKDIRRVSVYEAVKLTDGDLYRMCANFCLLYLEQLWFASARYLTVNAVELLMGHCPHLRVLGQVTGWNITLNDVDFMRAVIQSTNTDLTLLPMDFFPKILIFITGCQIISAKTFSYHPYHPFHRPWAIKYPQPIISLEGAWPMEYSHQTSRHEYPHQTSGHEYSHQPSKHEYPHQTSGHDYSHQPSRHEYPHQTSGHDYPYFEDTYRQELLTKSLNQALIKLNRLLPPSILNEQETTPFPSYTNPEVVAESLNRAVDRLCVLLTRRPVNNNCDCTSTEIPKQNFIPPVTNLPNGDVVNNNQDSSTTEKLQQTTIASEKISNSVSGAIAQLDLLFATLPDELKANPTKLPVGNNNNEIVQNKPPNFEQTLIDIPMFIPENPAPNDLMLSKNPDQKQTTENTLFTSHPLAINKERNKIEGINNNIELFTSVPHKPGSSVITTTTQTSNENKLFTSIVPTGNNVATTTFSPTQKDVITSPTVKTTENNLITSPPVTSTENNLITTPVVPTENDVFTSPALPTDITTSPTVLPTENSVTIITTSSPVIPTEINIVTSSSSSENNIQTTENNIETTEKNIETRVSSENESNENNIESTDLPIEVTIKNEVLTTTQIIPIIDVRFSDEGSDMIIFPDQFEEMKGQNKEPMLQILNLENRFGETSTQISLEYKPSRPPFHPEVFPPNPTAQTESNLQASTISQQKPVENNQNVEYNPFNPDVFRPDPLPPLPQPESNLQINLGDRNKPTTVSQEQKPVNNQNTQINLEYVPSRPPFHPDIYPPNPSPRPQTQTDSNLQNFDLSDRNKPTTISPEQKPINTENPQTILEYIPSRPPFHPDVFPPNPSPKPQTDLNIQNINLGDRNKPTTLSPEQKPVNTENPQTILEYKPSRPPFHPDVFPPVPTGRPQTDSNLQTGTNFELGDRNKPGNVYNEQNQPQTQTPIPVSTTTQIIFTTTKNNEPYSPTHYYSTPISLEYKPTRPFYAPNPIVYPKPRPWPAVSTDRPKN